MSKRAAALHLPKAPGGRAMIAKRVGELTRDNLEAHRVWEFDLAKESLSGRDETWVAPVTRLPVSDLANRVIGTPLTLANGTRSFGMFACVDLASVLATQPFHVLSVER